MADVILIVLRRAEMAATLLRAELRSRVWWAARA